jgi:hypothetical protein
MATLSWFRSGLLHNTASVGSVPAASYLQTADTAMRAHVRQGLEKELQDYGIKIG